MSFPLPRAVPVAWCCLLLAQHGGCARPVDPAAAGVEEPSSLADTSQQQETTPAGDAVVEEVPAAAPTPERVEPARPWGGQSRRIWIQGVGRDGVSRFEAERQELTPAQLEALDGLRGIPTPPGPPGVDSVRYQIRITDGSGAVVSYRAADFNLLDGEELDPTLPSIDVYTLEPFLEASHCLAANETRDRFLYEVPMVSPDAGIAAWSQAPAISSATPGCFHAIALPVECLDVPVRLDVETAGTYQLSLVDCFQPVALAVLSADGSVELGAASGGAADCPVLVQSFAAPGSYPLVIRKYTDCEGSGVSGWVFLRVRR
jgi:hypothetical protein